MGEIMSDVAIPGPKEQIIPAASNLFKAVTLFAMLMGSFALTQWLVTLIESFTAVSPALVFIAKWAMVSVMAVIDVMILIGMGVLAHDAVHRVLFRNQFLNELVGGILSALAFLPFYANRQFHLTHHSYAHQPGLDPENSMHNRSLWQAMTLGSVVALLLQVKVMFKNILRICDLRYASRAIKDIMLMSGMVYFYFFALPSLGISAWYTAVPILALFPPVFGVRAMSDHYGLPANIRRSAMAEETMDADEDAALALREQRQREVSGWVVITSPWLAWLWSNVNYHEVHHKYPWLSFRYLPQAFAATQSKHAYLVVKGYWRSLFMLRNRKYYCQPEEVAHYRQPA